jgi:hypothetical protein
MYACIHTAPRAAATLKYYDEHMIMAYMLVRYLMAETAERPCPPELAEGNSDLCKAIRDKLSCPPPNADELIKDTPRTHAVRKAICDKFLKGVLRDLQSLVNFTADTLIQVAPAEHAIFAKCVSDENQAYETWKTKGVTVYVNRARGVALSPRERKEWLSLPQSATQQKQKEYGIKLVNIASKYEKGGPVEAKMLAIERRDESDIVFTEELKIDLEEMKEKAEQFTKPTNESLEEVVCTWSKKLLYWNLVSYFSFQDHRREARHKQSLQLAGYKARRVHTRRRPPTINSVSGMNSQTKERDNYAPPEPTYEGKIPEGFVIKTKTSMESAPTAAKGVSDEIKTIAPAVVKRAAAPAVKVSTEKQAAVPPTTYKMETPPAVKVSTEKQAAVSPTTYKVKPPPAVKVSTEKQAAVSPTTYKVKPPPAVKVLTETQAVMPKSEPELVQEPASKPTSRPTSAPAPTVKPPLAPAPMASTAVAEDEITIRYRDKSLWKPIYTVKIPRTASGLDMHNAIQAEFQKRKPTWTITKITTPKELVVPPTADFQVWETVAVRTVIENDKSIFNVVLSKTMAAHGGRRHAGSRKKRWVGHQSEFMQ